MIDVKHRYMFETYFFLGENRTISKLAHLQMSKLYAELPRNSTEYQKKFGSLYMKLRRWAEKEKWDEEALKRMTDERRQADRVRSSEEEGLTETIQMYRRMVRYLLQKFAEKVADDSVKISNLKEAKTFMQLDMYLTQIIDRRPKSIPSKILEMMNSDERRQSDRVFEWLRKQAGRSGIIDDLGDIVEAEAEVETEEKIKKALPPGPVKEEIVDKSLTLGEAPDEAELETITRRRLEREAIEKEAHNE